MLQRIFWPADWTMPRPGQLRWGGDQWRDADRVLLLRGLHPWPDHRRLCALHLWRQLPGRWSAQDLWWLIFFLFSIFRPDVICTWSLWGHCHCQPTSWWSLGMAHPGGQAVGECWGVSRLLWKIDVQVGVMRKIFVKPKSKSLCKSQWVPSPSTRGFGWLYNGSTWN